MGQSLRVGVLEPYYGGSHAAFVDAFIQHSRHDCVLATLPARKWKWRMRGSAMWFALQDISWLQGGGAKPIDVILCNDMLSVADLRSLLPQAMRSVPIVCYFHENQLTYPLSDDDMQDYQYGMTNITSCLTADSVWFNSLYHQRSFLSAADTLLKKMPDHVPTEIIQCIENKSQVVYPAVDVGNQTSDANHENKKGPITILWCHRWEYDKNPNAFFDAIRAADQLSLDFDIVAVGEQFRTAPPIFSKFFNELSHRVRHAGFVHERLDYLSLVAGCDVVVSTANQENFGIAVVEAMLLGCQPLFPNRLSYPELLPGQFHADCIFQNDNDFTARLLSIIRGEGRLSPERRLLLTDQLAKRFAATQQVQRMDDRLEDIFIGMSK